MQLRLLPPTPTSGSDRRLPTHDSRLTINCMVCLANYRWPSPASSFCLSTRLVCSLCNFGTVPHRKHHFQEFLYCCVFIRCRENVFTAPLPSNGHIYSSNYFGFQPSYHCLTRIYYSLNVLIEEIKMAPMALQNCWNTGILRFESLSENIFLAAIFLYNSWFADTDFTAVFTHTRNPKVCLIKN
jgi:hypothetical protein